MGWRLRRWRALLNYFIRPQEHRRRDGQAEGLGGLEIDDQLVLRSFFDRKVGKLGTHEDSAPCLALPAMLTCSSNAAGIGTPN